MWTFSKYERILAACFLLTLPLLRPWIHGDGRGYYAYGRALLLQHNLDFELDWEKGYQSDPKFRGARRGPARYSGRRFCGPPFWFAAALPHCCTTNLHIALLPATGSPDPTCCPWPSALSRTGSRRCCSRCALPGAISTRDGHFWPRLAFGWRVPSLSTCTPNRLLRIYPRRS